MPSRAATQAFPSEQASGSLPAHKSRQVEDARCFDQVGGGGMLHYQVSVQSGVPY